MNTSASGSKVNKPGIDDISIYSARGNVYAVVHPSLANRLCNVPYSASAAADFLLVSGATFAGAILERIPAVEAASLRDGLPLIDGVMLAPFQVSSPFDAVIVNTDGTLAERSGNGITNLARYLMDIDLIGIGKVFELIVHAGNGVVTTTHGQSGAVDGRAGFWLEMGKIGFGLSAVHAVPDRVMNADNEIFEIPPLREIEPSWCRSVLVNVGNPHCVTFVDDQSQLPTNEELRSSRYFDRLKEIAFKPVSATEGSSPFRQGINLQWAYFAPENDAIHARIFERGEGPTQSSGTSATAIAAAAHHIGLTSKERVRVIMPGGTAFIEVNDMLSGMVARYFGVAERLSRNF